MSDAFWISLMVFTSFNVLVFSISVFGGQTSAWQMWVAHRTAIGTAKLEVKKLEAAHARKCPRATDGEYP